MTLVTRVRSGRVGLGLIAVLGAVMLTGCGGAASGNSDAVKHQESRQESQAIKAVAPTLHNAGISQSLVRQATHGGLSCPQADRGVAEGTATFTFASTNRVSFTEDACPVIEVIVGHPELSYRGPAGCRGQFFFGDGASTDPSTGLVDWFRYGAHDAYLIRFGNQVYHFAAPPRISHGRLVFDHDFGNERIVVTVSCPPPRPSGWLLPPSA